MEFWCNTLHARIVRGGSRSTCMAAQARNPGFDCQRYIVPLRQNILMLLNVTLDPHPYPGFPFLICLSIREYGVWATQHLICAWEYHLVCVLCAAIYLAFQIGHVNIVIVHVSASLYLSYWVASKNAWRMIESTVGSLGFPKWKPLFRTIKFNGCWNSWVPSFVWFAQLVYNEHKKHQFLNNSHRLHKVYSIQPSYKCHSFFKNLSVLHNYKRGEHCYTRE